MSLSSLSLSTHSSSSPFPNLYSLTFYTYIPLFPFISPFDRILPFQNSCTTSICWVFYHNVFIFAIPCLTSAPCEKMEVTFLENYMYKTDWPTSQPNYIDQPTKQQTDMKVEREVSLSIRILIPGRYTNTTHPPSQTKTRPSPAKASKEEPNEANPCLTLCPPLLIP